MKIKVEEKVRWRVCDRYNYTELIFDYSKHVIRNTFSSFLFFFLSLFSVQLLYTIELGEIVKFLLPLNPSLEENFLLTMGSRLPGTRERSRTRLNFVKARQAMEYFGLRLILLKNQVARTIRNRFNRFFVRCFPRPRFSRIISPKLRNKNNAYKQR